VLTRAEYLRESGLSDDELRKGNLRAASARLMALLARIEALPEGKSLGYGSYEHCIVLSELARCLRLEGKLIVAEYLLRQALAKIDTLIMQQPGTQVFIRLRRVLLSDLGDILRTQGQYLQAKESYEEVLKLTTQIEGKYMHA
jgi:hypothetical protein